MDKILGMLRPKYLNKLLKPLQTNFQYVGNVMNKRNKFGTTTKAQNVNDEDPNKIVSPLGDMSTKYQVFPEENSEVVLDVYEERLKYSNLLEEESVEEENPFVGLNLERGETGVFEIEDLVDVLQRENSEDIFVVKVPHEIKYVDYICIVSGKSQRHMQSIAQFVRRVYKQKRQKSDIIPKLEGEHSNDWMALDLGNIALHIFSKKARKMYDLDSLWALGPQFDDECNKKEPVSEMLERHSLYLEGLEPAS